MRTQTRTIFAALFISGAVFAQAPDTLDIRRGVLQLKSGATTNIGLRLRFFEASAQSGNNYFEIRAPRALVSNVSMIWPAAAPSPGQFFYAATADSFGWHAGFTIGSDAFSGTATTDTVTVAEATINDTYFIQLTGSAAPLATDSFIVEILSTGFVLHRSALGTSGMTYDWMRIPQ